MHKPSLQRLFLTGLLTLLPIWLTWVVVKFVFVLLSDTSRPLIGPLLQNLTASYPQVLGWLVDPWVQTAFGLLATLFVILLSGVMARRVIGQRVLGWFESLIKREAGVKDSSGIIPGHGGVLDRVDSMFFVLPVAYLLLSRFLIFAP